MWVRFEKQRGRRRLRSCAKRGGRKSNVAKRAIGPKPVMSLMRRKRLVSRIWLDKVLAGEREVETSFNSPMDEFDLNAKADQLYLSMPFCKETFERMRTNSRQVWCEPKNVIEVEYKRARGNIILNVKK